MIQFGSGFETQFLKDSLGPTLDAHDYFILFVKNVRRFPMSKPYQPYTVLQKNFLNLNNSDSHRSVF